MVLLPIDISLNASALDDSHCESAHLMTNVSQIITAHLRPVVGLPLSVTRRAADIRGFHFGEMRSLKRGNGGAYVLHVQCPWRLEYDSRIYIGSRDLWEPSSGVVFDDDWDYECGNLQDEQLAALLGGSDSETGSAMNTSGLLVVEKASGTELGGAVLHLSGKYQLVIFPDGSKGESWRLLGHQAEEHLVITGGQIESE